MGPSGKLLGKSGSSSAHPINTGTDSRPNRVDSTFGEASTTCGDCRGELYARSYRRLNVFGVWPGKVVWLVVPLFREIMW